MTFPELVAQDFTCVISFNLHKPYRRKNITQSPHITDKETEVLGHQTTSSKSQRKHIYLEPRLPDTKVQTLPTALWVIYLLELPRATLAHPLILQWPPV